MQRCAVIKTTKARCLCFELFIENHQLKNMSWLPFQPFDFLMDVHKFYSGDMLDIFSCLRIQDGCNASLRKCVYRNFPSGYDLQTMKISNSHFLTPLLTTTVTVKILFMTIPLKKRDDVMSA